MDKYKIGYYTDNNGAITFVCIAETNSKDYAEFILRKLKGDYTILLSASTPTIYVED